MRWRGDGPLAGLPAPVVEPYAPQDISFAVAAWPLRAAEELRSALIFRALAHASARAPITAAWTRQFQSAAQDEIAHARLCAAVGARLGAEPPRWNAQPVHARLASMTEPLFRAAALTLVEVAIGETISMTLFRAGRRGTTEPLSLAALESILADEVRHQLLGWEALAALTPDEALQHEASRALALSEQQIALPALRRLEANEPFDPTLAALGVLPPAIRVDAFYLAIESLVIPHLTRAGLDGARAWADRYRL